MKRDHLLLAVILAFLIFALKLECNQHQNKNEEINPQSSTMPTVLPVLKQNQVAVNPKVNSPNLLDQQTPPHDTKDFQEVDEKQANAGKPHGPQM